MVSKTLQPTPAKGTADRAKPEEPRGAPIDLRKTSKTKFYPNDLKHTAQSIAV